MNWLQDFYEEGIAQGHWAFTTWYDRYSKNVKSFRSMFSAETEADDVDKDTLRNFIFTKDNEVSNLGQGCYTNEEYDRILSVWGELHPIFKKAVQGNKIDKADYDRAYSIISKLTSKEKKAAYHRLWAGLLPDLLSTIIVDGRLKTLSRKLREKGVDCPEWNGDWLDYNMKQMEFFAREVKFREPWHRATFAWSVYCKLVYNKDTEPMTDDDIAEYIQLLKSNGNIVLTGAPGTGKTYLAQKIAKEMTEGKEGHVGMVQFHPSYDYTDFVEGLRPATDEAGFERVDGVFKEFCAKARSGIQDSNFDEAYQKLTEELDENYGDDTPMTVKTAKGTTFGIQMNSRGNLRLFTGPMQKPSVVLTKAGLFDNMRGVKSYDYHYKRAVVQLLKDKYGLSYSEKHEKGSYVFIIDEINRGELSKIFGELFFAIDPGYRGEKGRVKTQYQNMVEPGDPFYEGFYVPENVYIIGTMNDIDRSVESMDFAVRRRFAWCEVSAETSMGMLDDLDAEYADKAKASMLSLNAAICDPDNGLSAAYEVGAAYYRKLKEYDGNFDMLWRYHISVLLHEYLRGARNADDIVDKTFKNAFYSYEDKN